MSCQQIYYTKKKKLVVLRHDANEFSHEAFWRVLSRFPPNTLLKLGRVECTICMVHASSGNCQTIGKLEK